MGEAAPSTGLSIFRKAILFAAPLVMMAAAWGGAVKIKEELDKPGEVPPQAESEPNGPRLFQRNCANCHGEKGDGNGLTYLDPKARYFGFERYKLASTTNGIPTDDDLLRVLRHGIPGTAMDSFEPILTEPQMRAIIGYLRELTRRGIFARLQQKAIKDDDYEPLEVATKSLAQSEIGPMLAMPTSFTPSSADSIAKGRVVYLKACANCHGQDGKGDGPQVNDKNFKNDNGSPARPRDLARGVYKGGGEPDRLYLRIKLGIPGTPMPASTTLSREEVDDLINYLRSMSGQE